MRSATAGGRKILLTYDAYRAHMSVRGFTLFLDHGVIAYALPAHTSTALQPCDVVLFSKFKEELNTAITILVSPGNGEILTMYNFCAALRTAYLNSFTTHNIQASLRRAGL